MADDLVGALLRLEDAFSLPDFHAKRQAAVVAVVVARPAASATFLGAQLWDRNYTLGRRLDMLDMLAVAARELATAPPTSSVIVPTDAAAKARVRPDLLVSRHAHAPLTLGRVSSAPRPQSITVVSALKPMQRGGGATLPDASAKAIALRVEAHTRRFSGRAIARAPRAVAANRLGACLPAFLEPLLAGPPSSSM